MLSDMITMVAGLVLSDMITMVEGLVLSDMGYHDGLSGLVIMYVIICW